MSSSAFLFIPRFAFTSASLLAFAFASASAFLAASIAACAALIASCAASSWAAASSAALRSVDLRLDLVVLVGVVGMVVLLVVVVVVRTKFVEVPHPRRTPLYIRLRISNPTAAPAPSDAALRTCHPETLPQGPRGLGPKGGTLSHPVPNP